MLQEGLTHCVAPLQQLKGRLCRICWLLSVNTPSNIGPSSLAELDEESIGSQASKRANEQRENKAENWRNKTLFSGGFFSFQLRSRAQIKLHTHLSALCLCVCVCISTRLWSNRHRPKVHDTDRAERHLDRDVTWFCHVFTPNSHYYWLEATQHCQKVNAQKCPEHS